MGFTKVKVEICNPKMQEKWKEVELLADTGAMYSVVQSGTLKKLEIEPIGKRKFTLANGEKIEREIGGALYRIGEYEGYASVIFGLGSDKVLLGVTALEEMGLQVDPITKELKPAELLLFKTVKSFSF
ncbi:Retroviral aspartyl protease [Methanophagales archaeon]|nr:MAG: Retroviral aspartyl protease [Methanophagales archaeon]RJS83600.1 MAG: Retroviral aspartyl protease [Methanophagales archaeon]